MANRATSFAAQIVGARSECLYLVRGNAAGKPCWYYVQVDKSKLPFFQKQLAANTAMTLTDYGVILHSGWGENPPEDLAAQMKKVA